MNKKQIRLFQRFSAAALSFVLLAASVNVVQAQSETVAPPVPLIPGKATVSGMNIASVIDGTDYTAEDGLGKDSSGTNNIVRTFDTVTYTLTYTTAMKSGADQPAGYTEGNLYFYAILPNTTIAEAQFDISSISSWATVQELQQGNDVVLTGFRHLDNGDQPVAIPGAGTLSIPVVIKASPNGKKIQPSFKVWLDGDEVSGTKNAEAQAFTVTAIPSLNVALDSATGGETYGVKTSSQGTVLGNGIIQDFSAIIQIGSKDTAKGVEAPAGPISFILNLEGTHTVNSEKADAAKPKMAYINTTDGTADITYADNGDGTVKVTVSNYSVPEISSDMGTPIDFIKLNIGVFQEQPEVIPNNEKYEIVVTDTDLSANGVSGVPIAEATPNTNDNQTVTDDDRAINVAEDINGNFYGACAVGTDMYNVADYSAYTQKNEIINHRIDANSSNQKELGEKVIVSAMSETVGSKNKNPFTSISNAITAADILIKINPDILELPDEDSWTLDIENNSKDISNAKLKIRYAAKPDGSDWKNVTEAKEATTRDLVYYDSRKEMKAANATCLGVVFEVRNLNIYGKTKDRIGVYAFYQFQVKNDAKLLRSNAIGWACYSARLYSSKIYTPTVDDHVETSSEKKAYIEEGIETSKTGSWNAERTSSADWNPCGYDADGLKTTDTKDGLIGNSFYVTGLTANSVYSIESKDSSGQTKSVYDVSNGDKQVDLALTPTIIATNDAPIAIAYQVRAYSGTQLTGTSVLGGVYNAKTRKVEGGTEIEPTAVKKNASGYVNYYFYIPSIRPSEIETLHVKFNISADEVKNGQSFSARSWFSYDEENTSLDKLSSALFSGTSYSVIKIGEMRFSKTVVTDGATAATGTTAAAKNGLTYQIGMQNTSAIDIENMKVLDILPYNGDLLGTNYNGTYSVKSILLALNGSTAQDNDIKLYYTESDIVKAADYNAASADPTDGNWTEAISTGTDTDPVYSVPEHPTAVLITGKIATGSKYTLNLPFDVSRALGSMGNEASVSSPNLPEVLHVNGTETKVERAVNIINTLADIATNNTNVIWPEGNNYVEILTAKRGYRLPDSISVKAGGNELTPAADPSAPGEGEYGYDVSTGKVLIDGTSVTEDIEVIATAVPVYSLTNKLTSITTDQSISQTIENGTNYSETLTPSKGYELPDTITVTIGGNTFTAVSGTISNGISYDRTTGMVSISGAGITDNVIIQADAVKTKCTVHFVSGEGGTVTGGADQIIDYGTAAASGASAVSAEGSTCIGWEYSYTGFDGKTYAGTVADYTSVSIYAKEVTFKAVFAGTSNLSVTADHGFVSAAAGSQPAETGSMTNASVAIIETEDGKFPGISSFTAQDHYELSTVTVRDKSGNVAGTLDIAKAEPQTLIVDGVERIFTVAVSDDKKTGTVMTENVGTGLIINCGFAPKSYTVTNMLYGLSVGTTGSDTATYGKDYSESINPLYVSGMKYVQPETISVKIDGIELKQSNDPANPKSGEYGYDMATGKVLISGEEIVGPVEISASASAAVENNLTDMISNNPQNSIVVGTEYKEILSSNAGYRNPDSITVTVGGTVLTQSADPANPSAGEYGYDKNTGQVIIPEGSVTGSILVNAKAVKTVHVTSTIENGHNLNGDSTIVDKDKGYKTVLQANDGYELPDEITVTIGDNIYKVISGKVMDGISYDRSTGILTISPDMLKGDVTFNAVCSKITSANKKSNGVNTGDANGNIMSFVFLLLTALAIAGGTVLARKHD